MAAHRRLWLGAAAPSLVVAGLLLFLGGCGAGRQAATSARGAAPAVAVGAGAAPAAESGIPGTPVVRPARPAPLTAAFHRGRREALRQLLPAHSVAVLFAAPPRLLAGDVDYPFHQDPDFFYLTGLREPSAVLLLFADPQPSAVAGGPPVTEQLYVRPSDAFDEQWNGARLGPEGAARALGFGRVLPVTAFVRRPPDLSRFERVCFLQPQPGEDGRDTPGDSTELPDLRRAFERAARLPADFSYPRERVFARLRAWSNEPPERLAGWVAGFAEDQPALLTDPVLRDFLAARTDAQRKAALGRLPAPGRFDLLALNDALDALRGVKQPEELTLLRYAIDATVQGHLAAQRAMTPETSEDELEGIHQLTYRRYGCRADGYWPIVGAGSNGCVLHYIANDQPRLGNDMVVMDVAATYGGYTADVTRTAPASGHFSPEQRQIYELVLRAQEAGIRECRSGSSFFAAGQVAQTIIGAGLVKLGLIAHSDSAYRYFPHGTSHHLGLDVHDRGSQGPLRPGMVITVEPGIYVPPNSPCDKKWWGIGCRIEDDILITDKEPENLSVGAPRAPEAVERLVAEAKKF